ncbi:MAG: tryptophan 2,3-dioxygenase [Gammaproteobacteria bacterium]|nr:tryptophan 2,3-dioxygenase [Gammaproteobacteria bacterium]NIR82030.1 tryptophan 2,3-dioxygenase [Gammaproteobacteria bacterium]NIR89258.1 tryptophan 2,3-dioxygenase [Gammaproteobacteria bacterium]NIU03140.1 tryptophan 2,3-dioxygenase [Gammaproteobacteria bacterium]NIV50656.1 tryptophan 2,3-dioxygenase [Gammaproteobacteria bacterium]
MSPKPFTYTRYLKLRELLALQQPVSEGPEHDEMLFIVIHQVYELWFKELLHEFDYLMQRLQRNETAIALHTLKRILTILKILVAQIDILETMTPLEFLSFRDRLESASGFESHQFRELEFALGLKERRHVERFESGSVERERLEKRLADPSLWDEFLRYLEREGYALPASPQPDDPARPGEAGADVQEMLIRVYRNDPKNTQVCERLVDLDEGLQEWRYRHVKMVQRTIGTKGGTGGSTGAEYLRSTLFKPVFPHLWAIRTEL